MVKKIGYLAVILATIGIFSIAKAADSGENLNIPQKNGTFDVPGHPKLKAHVFVHYPRLKIRTAPDPTQACGIADPDSLASIPGAGWSLPASFTYNLNPSSAPASIGGQANMRTLSRNSFAVWQNSTSNKVTFVEGAETAIAKQSMDQKNIVAWGRTPQSALGVTYIIAQDSRVIDMDTIFNNKMVWSWSNPSGWNTPVGSTCAVLKTYDAQNILTHELGHWMGLADVYDGNFSNNTMFGYGSKGETKKNTLTTGDVAGLKSIYGF